MALLLCLLAAEASIWHNAREEPRHGGRREEALRYEATAGYASRNQEIIVLQLCRNLQNVMHYELTNAVRQLIRCSIVQILIKFVGASNKLGEWVWVIRYVVFLHGLAQQWRSPQKQN